MTAPIVPALPDVDPTEASVRARALNNVLLYLLPLTPGQRYRVIASACMLLDLVEKETQL